MAKKEGKEVLISVAKSSLGAIPYAGTALNEMFFDHRERVKQNRFNRFVEILGEGFTDGTEFNLENVTSEDFGDLFESVLRRVVKTKSDLKLQRFREILLKQIREPSNQMELSELYLDLVAALSEEEISILFHHQCFDLSYEERITEMNRLKDQRNEIAQKKKRETIIYERSKYADEDELVNGKISEIEKWLDTLQKFRRADFYNLPESKFMLFKQRLQAQGLLVDNRMNRIGGGNFQNMGITEFGLEFLDFIQEKNELV
ncbi:hypothetical protein [Flagellimonas nanhaiensis]|uniref:Uncharacterized protein n=1 Tax=Flagellimonas nanhaiensis TaxID=2292706 RepID=A0A371JMK9_9FLAO|nr:hypothetical protein [Allomuricauda nanhaiensis]RDY58381.1 hypothetical protein DX873_15365 [Allomuricauda nanhaiensis]